MSALQPALSLGSTSLACKVSGWVEHVGTGLLSERFLSNPEPGLELVFFGYCLQRAAESRGDNHRRNES